MKKFLPTILISLSLLMTACSLPPDTSHPWKDDSGKWHTHRVCQEVHVTDYIQIPAGKDDNGNTKYINIPHTVTETQCNYE